MGYKQKPKTRQGKQIGGYGTIITRKSRDPHFWGRRLWLFHIQLRPVVQLKQLLRPSIALRCQRVKAQLIALPRG